MTSITLKVFTSTILQQVFQVEYLVQYTQFADCAKLAAKNTWKALVQVRQKVPHKRTFLFLEQLILKHSAQKETISVKEVKDGFEGKSSSTVIREQRAKREGTKLMHIIH